MGAVIRQQVTGMSFVDFLERRGLNMLAVHVKVLLHVTWLEERVVVACCFLMACWPR